MDLDRRGFLQAAGAAAFMPCAKPIINVAFFGHGVALRKNLRYAVATPGLRVIKFDDFRQALADPSIHAVYTQQSDLAVSACEAGKDVWLETPAFTNLKDAARLLEAARRYGRVVQTDAAHRSAAHLREARDLVQRGDLGRVTFCRALGPAAVIDMLQFVFNEAVPLSVAAQSRLTTYQYPTFIASHETGSDTVAPQLIIHGTDATLTLSRSGYRLHPSTRNAVAHPDDMHRAHWANFAASIRTRQQPTASIETYVRTTNTLQMAARELSE